jgi:hypothetical protein
MLYDLAYYSEFIYINVYSSLSLSHKSMPIRAEKPLEINPIEATIGFYPG